MNAIEIQTGKNMSHDHDDQLRTEIEGAGVQRRDFLKKGAAAGAAVAAATVPGAAMANRHPWVNPGSSKELDRNTYVSNMEVLAHFEFPTPPNMPYGFHPTAGKMNMTAIGKRRFIFQAGYCYDVTDPKKATLINEKAFPGVQIQAAYNKKSKKWIVISSHEAPLCMTRPDAPRGKWDDPRLYDAALNFKGLRGVRFWDATNPEKISLLSEWATDAGDPKREMQTGSGTHRNFYAGGRYAYLDAAPSNDFTNHMESGVRAYTYGIQTVDLNDPEKPKLASNWWFPGQRNDEVDAHQAERWAGDKVTWNCSHGAMVVPINVEDGGKYGYTAYGAYGLTIHDVSNPAAPKLVGRFDPKPVAGAIPFHTVDTSFLLSHGVILTNSETLSPDCNEPYQDAYVIDVKDPTNPTALARIPRPVPPPEAPYTTFCNKRGRYGTHNLPHVHAPGKPHGNITFFATFNSGIQAIDLSRLTDPTNVGHFIPPQGGSLDVPYSWNRDTDNVLVEWDRNLIWVATSTGLYLLSHPQLGKPSFDPAEVKEWVLPALNQGHNELKG